MKNSLIILAFFYFPYKLNGFFLDLQQENNYNEKLGVSSISSFTEFEPDSIINLFAGLLNSYINNEPIGYFNGKNGKCYGGFEIIDLSDTSNNSFNNLINFEANHVYVFGPTRKSIQYSNIAIVQKDTIYFYKAINCPVIGMDVSGLINTLQRNEFEVLNKENVINLIYYYTNHSLYDFEMDPHEQIYGGIFQCDTL